MLVDRYGYLWISTDDGVFRYNGYDLKRYGYNDGLANTDVWGMQEDNNGRVWLKSIANQIGYIYNNRFVRVHKLPGPVSQIYPDNITQSGDSIIFRNRIITETYGNNFCIIVNDTLYSQTIYQHNDRQFTSFLRIEDDLALEISNHVVSTYDFNELISNSGWATAIHKYTSQYDIEEHLARTNLSVLIAKRYLVYGSIQNNSLKTFDIYTGKDTVITLPGYKNQELLFFYSVADTIYIITNNAIYIFNNDLHPSSIIDLKNAFSEDVRKQLSNGVYYLSNNLWGKLIATSNNGFYQSFAKSTLFMKNSELSGYTFSGYINDSTGLWWNKDLNTAAHVYKGSIVRKVKLPGISKIYDITSYNNQILMINDHKTHWLNDNSIQELTANIDYCVYQTMELEVDHYTKKASDHMFGYMSDAVLTDSNTVYYVGAGYNGLTKATFDYDSNKVIVDSIYFDRFSHITHDNANTIVCYSSDKVMIYNMKSGQKSHITAEILHILNINHIEQIIAIGNGHYYVKDNSRLYKIDINKQKATQVFSSYPLEKAKVHISGDKLYVAGSFGIAYISVNNPDEITTLPNTKNIYYKYVNDVQFSEEGVLMNTDNGGYYINVTDTTFNNHKTDVYRLILKEGDSIYAIKNNDTITVDQKTKIAEIDVINPTGTGKASVKHVINGNNSNSGNQLVLAGLKPGSYNTISIIASDFSWKSRPVVFYVFIQPYWWQTTAAKRIINGCILLAVIGSIYLIVVMTRRAATAANDRRNQRRELELKSIYSQINPHFIFNSLSTAQYFVKKNKNKEAYAHINQFSDLLRSYIKSSRNKYITIEEEIDNLNNYLELQLTRFEEKFNYNIDVASSIDASKVKIPSLLLQPLVENALNHGIFHMEGKGELNIKFKHGDNKQDELICIVKDNGIGREKSKALRSSTIKKADSYGTILIKELIDTFNKYEKIKIDIKYIDKAPPESGTKVIISIKNYIHA